MGLVLAAATTEWSPSSRAPCCMSFVVLVAIWWLTFCYGFAAAPHTRLATLPPRFGLPLHLVTRRSGRLHRRRSRGDRPAPRGGPVVRDAPGSPAPGVSALLPGQRHRRDHRRAPLSWAARLGAAVHPAPLVLAPFADQLPPDLFVRSCWPSSAGRCCTAWAPRVRRPRSADHERVGVAGAVPDRARQEFEGPAVRDLRLPPIRPGTTWRMADRRESFAAPPCPTGRRDQCGGSGPGDPTGLRRLNRLPVSAQLVRFSWSLTASLVNASTVCSEWILTLAFNSSVPSVSARSRSRSTVNDSSPASA